MNVLFLDFDGPLFPDRTIRYHPDNRIPYPGVEKTDSDWMKRVQYWRMDEISVNFLNELYSLYPFKTVVSSTWRNHCTKELIEELFELNSLDMVLHDDWRTEQRTFRSCRRVEEINEWLEAHPEVEDYIILDDKGSAASINGVLEYKERQELEVHRREWNRLEGNTEYPQDKYIEVIYPRITEDNVVLVNAEFGISTYDFFKMRKIVKKWAGIPEDPINPLYYAFI